MDIEEIKEYLDGMGIDVTLSVRAVHKWHEGGKLDYHEKQFVEQHWFKIYNYLVEELVKKNRSVV